MFRILKIYLFKRARISQLIKYYVNRFIYFNNK